MWSMSLSSEAGLPVPVAIHHKLAVLPLQMAEMGLITLYQELLVLQTQVLEEVVVPHNP